MTHRDIIATKREMGFKTWVKPRHDKKAAAKSNERPWYKVTDWAR